MINYTVLVGWLGKSLESLFSHSILGARSISLSNDDMLQNFNVEVSFENELKKS